ncbi:MAG: hypothetical protein QXM16_01810 [Nitrososphaerota archaeon]
MSPEWDVDGDGYPDIDGDGIAGEPGADDEAGDIFYVRSSGPPYKTWSRPHMVGDDYSRLAQGYPTVNVRADSFSTKSSSLSCNSCNAFLIASVHGLSYFTNGCDIYGGL